MRKYFSVIGSISVVVAIMISAGFIFNDETPNDPKASAVNWMTFEEAVEAQKTEPRLVFIDVYTDWCGWCKKMDANTFNQEHVAKLLNEKFYAVKFNAEQKEDIKFKDYTFKFVPQGRRGYHQLAASLLNNQLSYPTTVFLDEEMNMIQPLKGYWAANDFYPILQFFGDKHYKSVSWEEFKKGYTAPF